MKIGVGVVDGIHVEQGLGGPFLNEADWHVEDLPSSVAELIVALSFIAHEEECYVLFASGY